MAGDGRGRLENLKPDEQLTLLLETAKESELLPPGLDEELVRYLFKLFKANVESLNNYTAPTFDGRATLFVADERFLKSIENPVPGWQRLVGKGLELDTVPGDHYTMLRKPNVRTLATKLGAYLDATGRR